MILKTQAAEQHVVVGIMTSCTMRRKSSLDSLMRYPGTAMRALAARLSLSHNDGSPKWSPLLHLCPMFSSCSSRGELGVRLGLTVGEVADVVGDDLAHICEERFIVGIGHSARKSGFCWLESCTRTRAPLFSTQDLLATARGWACSSLLRSERVYREQVVFLAENQYMCHIRVHNCVR